MVMAKLPTGSPLSPGRETLLFPETERAEAERERTRAGLKREVFRAPRPEAGAVREKALSILGMGGAGFAGTGIAPAGGEFFPGQDTLTRTQTSMDVFYSFLEGMDANTRSLLAVSQQDRMIEFQTAIDEAIDEAQRRAIASNPLRRLLGG